jgi:hypothetical protein
MDTGGPVHVLPIRLAIALTHVFSVICVLSWLYYSVDVVLIYGAAAPSFKLPLYVEMRLRLPSVLQDQGTKFIQAALSAISPCGRNVG